MSEEVSDRFQATLKLVCTPENFNISEDAIYNCFPKDPSFVLSRVQFPGGNVVLVSISTDITGVEYVIILFKNGRHIKLLLSFKRSWLLDVLDSCTVIVS